MGKHSVADSGSANSGDVREDWRRTARTVFQVAMGLVVVLPAIVPLVGLSATAGVGAAVITVCAVAARVMALPEVNEFLDRFVPWLRK